MWANSSNDIEEPSRAKYRSEIELPKEALSITARDDPKFTMPNCDKTEPKRANLLSETVLPNAAKQKTDKAEPMRVKLLKDTEEPSDATLRIESENRDPKREPPRMDTDEPTRDQLLIAIAEPKTLQSKTEILDPRRPKFLRESDAPSAA